ncbi:MAG: hypothetical protein KDD66_00785 [Bdellovibrionales bacterium]|nr:hypothetical protein [Bdellovibrionales bacterium]
MKRPNTKAKAKEEKGSLSLEQILFVAAVVGIGAGLTAFYGNISSYLTNVGFNAPPSGLG